MTAFTEASTFDATVTKIADGDDVSAAITNAPLQSLTDRTRYLYDALVAGATHARTVADAAALRALTSHVSGDLAALGGGNGGKLFLYDAASSLTDDGVLIVKPTDVGGGAGRWLVPALVLLGRENTWSSLQHFAAVLATSVSTTGGGTIASDGDLTAGGDCAIVGTAYVGGACTLAGLVTCSAGLVVNGGSGIDCNGPADVSGASDLHGAVRCYSTLQADGNTTLAGGLDAQAATFHGSVLFDGGGIIQTRIGSQSVGRISKRVVAGANADTTYGINDADVIVVKALTADRTYTLSETGASSGDVIKFATEDNTWVCNIANADGVGMALIVGSGSVACVEYTYLDGVWRLTMAHKG
jgi:hypothetical protein